MARLGKLVWLGNYIAWNIVNNLENWIIKMLSAGKDDPICEMIFIKLS